MNAYFRNRPLPAGNPLANILVVVVGIIVISLSLALGFVVFLGIATFMLIMAMVVSIRVWWFKRRIKAAAKESQGQPSQPTSGAVSGRVIEGEFEEVRYKRDL